MTCELCAKAAETVSGIYQLDRVCCAVRMIRVDPKDRKEPILSYLKTQIGWEFEQQVRRALND